LKRSLLNKNETHCAEVMSICW